MIRFISRNVSWICLVTSFLRSGIKKEKNADRVQTHAGWLLADRVMNKNLLPGLSASRSDGASYSNLESHLLPLITASLL